MPVDKKMAILVVDDSATMRMMFKQMLESSGFENIVFAVNGNDAIEKLQETKIDLVISDWNMPEKDGLEFLQWVRSSEFKDVPFIMATAQGDKAQQARARQEGANSHIAKPFDADQLLERIELALGLREEVQAGQRETKTADGKVRLRIGHIQITDHLALGVLRHRIAGGEVTPKTFELETLCMPGWNPIQEALERGDIDGAFVLAPIAMDLFAFDVPIRLILLAHKNGSIFVRSNKEDLNDHESLADFFKYKVVDIPHKMSVHNMLAHQFLTELGLKPGVPGKKAINVRFEVVPPIQMPAIMQENENVGGFIVAEPIGSNAIAKGIAAIQFLSASMWENHPCCVVAMRQECIDQYPDAVHELASLLVEAGRLVEQDKERAAEIAVAFLDPKKELGLTKEVLQDVLNQPQGIKMDDLYPVLDDLDKIQRYMHDEMGIGTLVDVEKFVDLRFADTACKG
ncbi:MAG: ABC transporter substrate-binding protein [Deltaproteobacteria bacterium]|nr:ABC transporter substrate-binding protein [Deltaproteobacteria bacterium]